MPLPVANINAKKAGSIFRMHPWIFSGSILSIATMQEIQEAKMLVKCLDESGSFLGIGLYSPNSSIAIRLLTTEEEDIDIAFWKKRIREAHVLRKKILNSVLNGNSYRLIHGEGDGIPGLIIDIYHDAAIIQCHVEAYWMHLKEIAIALDQVFGESLKTIFCKSKETLNNPEADFWLKGQDSEVIFREMGIQVKINWVEGQKTGYFLDQCVNRLLVSKYAHGMKMLDLFCNVGGFSLHALRAGASEVWAVDSSSRALEMLSNNAKINQLQVDNLKIIQQDCVKFLQQTEPGTFDLIVCDPPAFAKSIQKRHNAVQGYKRLNSLSMKCLKRGGILFTFSCSQVVDENLFLNTIMAAGLETKRKVRILHKLSQGPDHPVNLYHHEGFYLKGLALVVH